MSQDESFTCRRCDTAARAERALAGSVGDPTRPEGYTATLSLIPSFGAWTAYREARRAAFRQSVARLQQASGAAVSTLLKIMVDTNAPHSTRVRAADSVLDHSAKAIEIEDIEARVAELERAAEQAKSSQR